MRNARGADHHPTGVFLGLATLDVIHRIDHAPGRNEKVTATAQFVSAGGPAANAAVTFAALGGTAVLVTALGADPVAELIRRELASHDVEVVDAAAGDMRPVPVSAVSVVQGTGERSVVSLDAVASDAPPPARLADLIDGADVVLVDGHHPRIASAGIRYAAARGVRVVADAGRWKPVMDEVIDHATDMVCSADFRLPNANTAQAMAAVMLRRGVQTAVITHGSDPVQWWSGGESGCVEVPAVPAVDTLGAGDAFHGAYCFYAADDVVTRITRSADIAALRVSQVGPRAWLESVKGKA